MFVPVRSSVVEGDVLFVVFSLRLPSLLTVARGLSGDPISAEEIEQELYGPVKVATRMLLSRSVHVTAG